MTNQHLITPPPELVQQWTDEAWKGWRGNGTYERDLAAQAARWGADQQLEQCVAWLDGYEHKGWAAEQMRNDCRLKPPSLKEQALAELETLSDYAHGLGCSESAIRRALEALPE